MGIIKKFRITEFKEDRPKILLKNISLSFNKRQILENINLTLRQGEICGLLGPNGVGKSSLFNIIIGSIKPDYGKVFINKMEVTNIPIFERALRFGVAIVPQTGGVFSDLSCFTDKICVSVTILIGRCGRIFFGKRQRGCTLERKCSLSWDYFFGLCYESGKTRGCYSGRFQYY